MNEEHSTVRRDLLALFAALGAGVGDSQAQDAVKMAPRNYRVAFENEKFRVLEFYSRPGLGMCGQGRHYHPQHLTIPLTDSRVRVTLSDNKVVIANGKAGEIFWAPAETHTAENVGRADARAYLVELKDADWKPSTWSEKG